MKIRILKERSIQPSNIPYPPIDPAFEVKAANSAAGYPTKGSLEVYMHYAVHAAIWQHSRLEKESELGGALIGCYGQYKGQSFLLITDVLHQPLSFSNDPTMIRFTNRFYSALHEHMEKGLRKNPNLLQLGLYHTHPDYGVFLSHTDEVTFKGVFKGVHQIALVVDPIRGEDGIFHWEGKELSKRTAFQLYRTSNAQYNPFQSMHADPIIQQYNRWGNKSYSDQSKPNTPQPLDKSLEKLRISDNEFEKPTSDSDYKSRTKLKVKSGLQHTPRLCPLYNMKYVSRSVRLLHYINSLKRTNEQHHFPYMVFLHRKIEALALQEFEKNGEALLFIKGENCHDRTKDLYFLYLDRPLALPLPSRERNVSSLERLQIALQAYKQQFHSEPLAWLYLCKELPDPLYPFYDWHRKKLSQSAQLGIIVQYLKGDNNTPDWARMRLVAHDRQQNQLYDHFNHVFLFDKPYD